MIKFEDIKKVNETISTIDVKGKNYADVIILMGRVFVRHRWNYWIC